MLGCTRDTLINQLGPFWGSYLKWSKRRENQWKFFSDAILIQISLFWGTFADKTFPQTLVANNNHHQKGEKKVLNSQITISGFSQNFRMQQHIRLNLGNVTLSIKECTEKLLLDLYTGWHNKFISLYVCSSTHFHPRETKANNIDETRKSFFFYGSYINIFMGSKGMLTIVTKKHHDACFSFSDFLLFCSKAKK